MFLLLFRGPGYANRVFDFACRFGLSSCGIVGEFRCPLSQDILPESIGIRKHGYGIKKCGKWENGKKSRFFSLVSPQVPTTFQILGLGKLSEFSVGLVAHMDGEKNGP